MPWGYQEIIDCKTSWWGHIRRIVPNELSYQVTWKCFKEREKSLITYWSKNVVYPSIGRHKMCVSVVDERDWWCSNGMYVECWCYKCIELGMLIGYLTLPYPILFHLDYMLYHTIFLYLTSILPLSYPYPTLIFLLNNQYKSWKISNLHWTNHYLKCLIQEMR
jgi:hypothetical protein